MIIFVILGILILYIIINSIKDNILDINKKKAVDEFLDNFDIAELRQYQDILSKLGFKANCKITKHKSQCVYCKQNTLYKIQKNFTTFICINPNCKKYLLERNANNLNLHAENSYLRENGKL